MGAAVHPVGRLHVRQRLVHVPLTGGVDDDRPGCVALRQRKPRAIGQRNGRTPPRVFHHIQCGTELFGGDDAVTGIGRRADGPVGGDRGALVLDPHLLIALEATTGQDHPPPGPDQLGLSGFRGGGVAHVDAAHHVVLDVEVGERGVQQDGYAGLAQPDAQRCDQRPAHADQVLAGRLGPHRACAHPQAAQQALRVALEQVQPHVILLQHNHVERHLAVRRLQAGQVGAELLGVERLRLDRSSARPAAGCLRVVVGIARHPGHLQRGVLQHEGQHLGGALKVGVDAFGLDNVADDAVQIGARGLRCIGDPVTLEDLVVRDPHPATGPGGGSTVVRGLLDDYC